MPAPRFDLERNRVGADRPRCRVSGDVHDDAVCVASATLARVGDGLRCEVGLGEQRVETGRVDAPVHDAVDHHRRTERAVPQAEHRVERHGTVGGGLAEPDPEVLLGVRHQVIGPDRLTRLGATHLHDPTSGRLGSEVAVEGHDPVHLGAREVEHVGDDGHGTTIDVPELPLQRVQHGQQRTALPRVRLGDGPSPLRRPRRSLAHGAAPIAADEGTDSSRPGNRSTRRNPGNRKAQLTAITSVPTPPSTIAAAGPSS